MLLSQKKVRRGSSQRVPWSMLNSATLFVSWPPQVCVDSHNSAGHPAHSTISVNSDENTIIPMIISTVLKDTEAVGAADRDSFARAIQDSIQTLAEDQPFKDLAQALTFLRYQRYSMNKMQVIDDCVRQCMSTHDEWVRLHTEWDPVHFMSSLTKEYGDESNDSLGLGCLLTLTGSDMFPHADTYMAYVKRTWPQLGHIIIGMLQSAILQAMGAPALARGRDGICRREYMMKLEENGDYDSL